MRETDTRYTSNVHDRKKGEAKTGHRKPLDPSTGSFQPDRRCKWDLAANNGSRTNIRARHTRGPDVVRID